MQAIDEKHGSMMEKKANNGSKRDELSQKHAFATLNYL